MARGKKVALGIGVILGMIFIALIAVGPAVMASVKSLDFTVSISSTNSGIPSNLGNKTTFMYDIDFVNLGSSKYLVIPIDFKIVTNTNSVYSDFPYPIGEHPLPYTELDQNQHAKGQLGFTVPKGESPKVIEYYDGFVKISKQLR